MHIRIHIPEITHHSHHQNEVIVGHGHGHGSGHGSGHGHGHGSSSGIPLEVLGSIIGGSSSHGSHGSSGYSSGGSGRSHGSSLSPGLFTVFFCSEFCV